MKKALRSFHILLIAIFILSQTVSVQGESLKYTLENGMGVVIKENATSPIVAVQVWVKAGSTTEPESLAGISHVLEHMAFKGTEQRGVGEIAREVESLGGNMNAYTTFDHTVYHITISSRYAGKAIEILADTLANSVFDPKELKKEIEVVMEEYRMNQDDPGRVVSRNLFSGFFEKHPYGRPVIGSPETLSKITKDEILSYFHRYYVPNNMVLVVAGNVTADQVKPQIEKHMGQLTPKAVPPVTRPAEPKREGVKVIIKKMDAKRAYVNIAFPGVSLSDGDVFSYDLLSLVLGQGETSRLVKKVKNDLGLVDSIYSYSFTPKDPGVMIIGASCEPERVKDAIRAILGEIYKVGSFGVTGAELERARKNTIADFVYSLESQSSLARLLGFYDTALGDPFFQERYIEMIRRVTREDMQEAARTYFGKDNFVVSLVLPEESTVSLMDDDVRAMADESYVSAFVENAPSGKDIERTVLSNGIRLVTRENHSVPDVAVTVGFLGGVRAETADTNGVSNLMASMLQKGTDRHSAAELSLMIEDMAGNVGFFSGRNSFGLEGKFLSDDFEKGVRILSEMILSPSFMEEEIEKRKKEVLASIKSQQDSPVQEVIRLYLEHQYGDHPYSMDPLGTEETVKGLTREQLVDFYGSHVFPENMVVVVSGDVIPEHGRKAIEEAFGGFSRQGNSKLAATMEVKPLQKAVTVEKKREKLQAHFIIGFLGTRFKDPDRYPLEVLSLALAGQGGRLFTELRDKKSLAYSVTAFSSEQYDRGFLAFYMGTAADKLPEAKQSMWDEIVKFLEEGMGEEELERAKNYVVGNFEIGLQSNSAYAMALMFNELYGMGLDEFKKYPERIKGVSRDDVIKVARKYIDMERYVLAIISP